MTQHSLNKEGQLDPRFLEKSYQEAMELTQAVASYLEIENEKHKDDRYSMDLKIYFACESLRISTCLMQAMSWFMVQKGMVAGEISLKEARTSKFKLDSNGSSLVLTEMMKAKLPKRLLEFHEKVQNLFIRVVRMDQLVFGEAESENPVHNLHDRLNKKYISD